MWLYSVPSLECHMAEVLTNGSISVQWRVTDTGGEPLSSLSLDYAVWQMPENSKQVFSGPPLSVSDVTAMIPVLPDAVILIMVTANNSAGHSTAECPVVGSEYSYSINVFN